MSKAEFIIHCQTARGMSLDDAKAEADIVYGKGNTTQPANQANAYGNTSGKAKPPELTEAAKKAIKVDEGWDDQITDHEEQAQQAVYPGQLRRIRRLTQEKLKARKFFDRAKMYM